MYVTCEPGSKHWLDRGQMCDTHLLVMMMMMMMTMMAVMMVRMMKREGLAGCMM